MAGKGLISQNGKRRVVVIDESRRRRGPGPQSTGKVRLRKQQQQRRRPSMNLLVELPMDIIFEIFGHLEPLDLLQLLETSKALNTLLSASSPSHTTIWKRARENISGLPDCPGDLSQVEYARLIFESHCQVCHQGKSYELRNVIRVWEARVRYCNLCFEANFVQEQKGRKEKESYPAALKAYLPSQMGWHRHLLVCRSLDDLWKREFKRVKTNEEKDRWVEAKIAERKMINKHATECRAWFVTWQKEKAARQKRMVENRKKLIMNRLRDMGWEEEISVNESCLDLLEDRRVRKACEQELSEKGLQDVVDYLEDYLEQAKELRLSLFKR